MKDHGSWSSLTVQVPGNSSRTHLPLAEDGVQAGRAHGDEPRHRFRREEEREGPPGPRTLDRILRRCNLQARSRVRGKAGQEQGQMEGAWLGPGSCGPWEV